MRKVIIAFFTLGILTSFVACNNNSEVDTSTNHDSSSVAATTPVGSNQNPAISAAPASDSLTSPGVNPPHGQPGHRCDIPDGTPLTPPTEVNATSSLSATNPLSVSPQSVASPTAGSKPNPAHGAPGHDCSIPVGSPLQK